MIPEAWENKGDFSVEWRAFYQFQLPPLHGPAAVAFTDGTVIGAAHCNGSRPLC